MERIPGCWTEQTEWNSTERPWMVIQGSSITGSMMGIYDDKVEQIDLKGQLKPFNINQLNRVMHIRSEETGLIGYVLHSI